MEWILTGDRPIFQQLYEQLARQIVSGAYQPGDRLPAVRELAAEAGVNPNTMQRAMAQLESAGLAEASRTSGRTVTEDRSHILAVQRELAMQAARTYLDAATALGLTPEEAAQLLTQKEETNHE